MGIGCFARIRSGAFECVGGFIAEFPGPLADRVRSVCRQRPFTYRTILTGGCFDASQGIAQECFEGIHRLQGLPCLLQSVGQVFGLALQGIVGACGSLVLAQFPPGAMSLFVIYFGTDRTYDDVAHHEILMGPRYQALLENIFTDKTLSDDFSLYLHRPTATDPSLAPPGCDSWYVLSPVPHLGGHTDWRVAAKPYRDRIMAYLEERYLPGLSKHVVTERRIDPLHFRDTLNSHLGSAFSVEPILTQSAWFRPHNRSEDIPNLYFAGAGTHPGAGIPGVLSSGKIVAEMIGHAK